MWILSYSEWTMNYADYQLKGLVETQSRHDIKD